jgi:hypothetical protein
MFAIAPAVLEVGLIAYHHWRHTDRQWAKVTSWTTILSSLLSVLINWQSQSLTNATVANDSGLVTILAYPSSRLKSKGDIEASAATLAPL